MGYALRARSRIEEGWGGRDATSNLHRAWCAPCGPSACVCVLEVWILPLEIDRTITTFPETKPLGVPGLIWAIAAITCCQIIVIIGLRLVALAREGRFEDHASTWLRAMVGCLIIFIALIVLAFATLAVLGYGTPAMAELILLGVIALIAAVALLATRATRRPRRDVKSAR